MILLIDNYDSFTYNLYHLIAKVYPSIKVVRNDKITLHEIEEMNPQAIIISPGPKTPQKAGITIDLIQKFSGQIPIFGVCLGLQAIATAFGATVNRAKRCVHGKADLVFHNERGLFKTMVSPLKGARYHSLKVEQKTLPENLKVIASSPDQTIMALEHVTDPTWGVQFHPESILSEQGELLISNFLKMADVIS